VIRVGSTDTFYLDIRNFTLKDPAQCTLIQKLKNQWPVKVVFKPGSHPAHIPRHATILALTYDDNNKFWCNVYDPATNDWETAVFDGRTFTEIK